LYIDTTLPAEETLGQVQAHLDWIKSEPAKALEMAKNAQQIFVESFTLNRCLENIYREFPARKEKLERLYTPKRPEEKICVVFLMPEFHAEVLEQHIASLLAQKGVSIRAVLAMDTRDVEIFGPRIRARLNELAVPFEIEAVHFVDRYPNGSPKRRRRAGEIISEIIGNLVQEDYLCIVASHERLFSDHICSLMRTLQDSEAGCAWSDALVTSRSEGKEHADLDDEPDIHRPGEYKPIGFGRFVFRISALGTRLPTTLPYLDSLAVHLLFGITKRTQKLNHLQPDSLSLDRMSPEGKTKLAVDLAHSVPFPPVLKKIAFSLYRLWFRLRSKE
jgi:hypothetical protein